MKYTVAFLIRLVDRFGLEYLRREPWSVYNAMIDDGLDADSARLVLHSLLAGAAEEARRSGGGNLSAFLIQKCHLESHTAAKLASMYAEVFSPDHLAGWEQAESARFQELRGSPWQVEWIGSGVWRGQGWHCDCDCVLTAELAVEKGRERVCARAAGSLLRECPSASAGEIRKFLSEQITSALDEDLAETIQGEEFEAPSMPDYLENVRDVLSDLCEDMGLTYQIVKYEGGSPYYEKNRGSGRGGRSAR